MIQIIAGKKGSGKTKRIIDMTNEMANKSDKNVVFIDDDRSYTLDINRNARFVNACEYNIKTPEMFLGFLCGMLSSNYDIGYIFIDAFLKLIKTDLADAEWFFTSMNELCKKHNIEFVLSISADPADLPNYLKGYII